LFFFPPRQSFCSLGFHVYFGVFPTCVPCGGRMALLGSLVVRRCPPFSFSPRFRAPFRFFCFLFLSFVFLLCVSSFVRSLFFLLPFALPPPPCSSLLLAPSFRV
jgi:hypothetical protein